MTKGTAESCQCPECRNACAHKPGWFLPGEAEAAAKAMNMDLQTFFAKYLAVDWWQAHPGNTYVLAPAIPGHEGRMYPARPTGTCVLFKDGLCTIHGQHPHECRAHVHTDTHALVKTRHAEVARAWEPHQAQIIALLGREPEAEEYSFLDSLTWGG
jgi:Fe-S-cluster containining protein